MSKVQRLPAVHELPAWRQASILGWVHANNIWPDRCVQRAHRYFGRTPRGGFPCLTSDGQERLRQLQELGYGADVDRGAEASTDRIRAWSRAATAAALGVTRSDEPSWGIPGGPADQMVLELSGPFGFTGWSECMQAASRAAEAAGLPMTLYFQSAEQGWQYSNALAVDSKPVAWSAQTVLPNGYFVH